MAGGRAQGTWASSPEESMERSLLGRKQLLRPQWGRARSPAWCLDAVDDSQKHACTGHFVKLAGPCQSQSARRTGPCAGAKARRNLPESRPAREEPLGEEAQHRTPCACRGSGGPSSWVAGDACLGCGFRRSRGRQELAPWLRDAVIPGHLTPSWVPVPWTQKSAAHSSHVPSAASPL